MEERLARLEGALEELRLESQQLRAQIQELRQQVDEMRVYDTAAPPAAQRRFWARWSVVALVAALVAVPAVAFSVWHTNAFWSTTIAAVNGILLYIVGPGVWRLLIEGLFRAIPAVLFGQAARVAVENYRRRKAK